MEERNWNLDFHSTSIDTDILFLQALPPKNWFVLLERANRIDKKWSFSEAVLFNA